MKLVCVWISASRLTSQISSSSWCTTNKLTQIYSETVAKKSFIFPYSLKVKPSSKLNYKKLKQCLKMSHMRHTNALTKHLKFLRIYNGRCLQMPHLAHFPKFSENVHIAHSRSTFIHSCNYMKQTS